MDNYNALIDLAVFGLFLIGLGLAARYLPDGNKRGATSACKLRVKWHQRRRREWMLCNGGLPVDMNEVGL